jgi:hypothetical protein
MTNITSIKSRLTNIAQKEKQTYQLILIRYFTERLILLKNAVYTEGSLFVLSKKQNVKFSTNLNPIWF